MAVANQASFFSRFTMKFVEVIGAGAATAVTGYLIAHLGGFWSAPARNPAVMPATVQMAPAVSTVPKSARAAAVPVSADANALPPAAKPDGAAPAREAAAPAAAATPPRKRAPEAAAIENKPHQPEGKPLDKDDTASVEEQVRAALAKVDANRRPSPEAAAPIESAPPPVAVVPAVAAVPAPPVAAASAAAPPTAISPPATAPAAVVPPLGTVEIKSQPVATVDATPPADDGKGKDRGFFATIEHIPDMLRPTSGATTAEPPRPPLPVGDSQ